MRIYIAGSMSSMHSEDRQFAMFDERAKRFREMGHEVDNPAERVVEEGGFGAWSDAIRDCIKRVGECDAIHLLPIWRGPGPLLEYFAALLDGLNVVDEDCRLILPPQAALSAGEIMEMMTRHG